jgi:hypothetical protein
VGAVGLTVGPHQVEDFHRTQAEQAALNASLAGEQCVGRWVPLPNRCRGTRGY